MSRIRIFLAFVFLISCIGILFGSGMASAWDWSPFSGDDTTIHLCSGGECTVDAGVNAVKTATPGLETEKTATRFITDVVLYLLTFVTLVAVIYIIYAGFMVLVSAGDEKKLQSLKNTILYILIGIVVMWLAYAIVSLIISALNRVVMVESAYAVDTSYTESDIGTFAEYQKKLIAQGETISAEYQLGNPISQATLTTLTTLVNQAFDTLPDTPNYASQNESIKKGIDLYIAQVQKDPSNKTYIARLIDGIQKFTTDAKIDRIRATIEASPTSGSAPLTVSLSAVSGVDPSGTQIPVQNYTWWMREPDGRRVIGRGPNIAYTFQQDQTYTVFLDITSESRNKKGRIAVLPFSQSVQIEVKPRVGTIYLYLNGVDVTNTKTFKITPAVGSAGIILDATASRSTAGSTIEKTNWKFGNGSEDLSYGGSPQIERQVYANKGKYSLSLELVNNQGKSFTKDLTLLVQDSNATISVDKTSGFIGENFAFTADSYFGNASNVEYNWDIKDARTGKSVGNFAGTSLSYAFPQVGTYVVTLVARPANGIPDADSRTITIDSRDPFASFEATNSDLTHPNTISLNALQSYDADTHTNNELTYNWRIDNEDVKLKNSKKGGAIGNYTFNSLGDHEVSLIVTSKNGKVSTVTKTITISSLLSVKFDVTPQVANIDTNFEFLADSPGVHYEWDFGDGSATERGPSMSTNHIYKGAGVYTITLTVFDQERNSNRATKTVFIGNAQSPLAVVDVRSGNNPLAETAGICNGQSAYRVDRSNALTLDGGKSINLDGSDRGLTYTWKYQNKIESTSLFTRKFDEIGCFPVTLTVKNSGDGQIDSKTIYLSVENLSPTLTSLTATREVNSKDTQKILVNVTADGASDADGVITSYVWYYFTEGQPEIQDVRVTQSPKTTFVLPNITEKYYFGVILEDNDGARVNSTDILKEKIPLIVSNDNGNINMPLLTLTTSNSHINVGEGVSFSVNARTILGKDVTNSSSYAWDFDGDGVVDRKGSSAKEEYTYVTQGTYQMKVKVTSNGVTNTKYQTIVVENALEPLVKVYTMGSKVFAINTSRGTFTSARWTLGDFSSENRDFLLYDFGDVESMPPGGTLSVSDGVETREATFALADSIAYMPSSQGISYLTNPASQNDTVTVTYPSERVMLALWMNPGNRYVIDTNTAVDTDLDGTTDNDEDNESTDSYNNGSPFIIYNGQGPRSSKQNVKITIYESGKLVGTKTITLLFPFFTDTSTGSGVLSSGSGSSGSTTGKMSSQDRDAIQKLDGLIRSTPKEAQDMLRKQYNLLIDNWHDGTEKARIVLEMRTIISTSGLDATDAQNLNNALSQILSQDIESVSEIDTAIRAIEGLIATSNQSGAIMEKMDMIRSHPTNADENKRIGTEILTMVKDDPSISPEYKLMLKSQLSRIISGGTGPIETPSSTSGGSGFFSMLIGFFIGFFQVIFWILLFLAVIIGIGFILYKALNKHPEMSYQDFIIDRVFHRGASKKELPPNPQVKAEAPPTPAPVTPPSESLLPTPSPAPSQTPLFAEHPTNPEAPPTPAPPASNSKVPSWLLEYDEENKAQASTIVTPPPAPQVPVVDDPLATALPATPPSQIPPPPSPPSLTEVKSDTTNTLPPWLTSMDEKAVDEEVSEVLTDTEDRDDMSSSTPVGTETGAPGSGAETSGIPSSVPEPIQTISTGTPPVQTDNALPSWLMGDEEEKALGDQDEDSDDLSEGEDETDITTSSIVTEKAENPLPSTDTESTLSFPSLEENAPDTLETPELLETPSPTVAPPEPPSSPSLPPQSQTTDEIPDWLRHVATKSPSSGTDTPLPTSSTGTLIDETEEVFPQPDGAPETSRRKRKKRKSSPTPKGEGKTSSQEHTKNPETPSPKANNTRKKTKSVPEVTPPQQNTHSDIPDWMQ